MLETPKLTDIQSGSIAAVVICGILELSALCGMAWSVVLTLREVKWLERQGLERGLQSGNPVLVENGLGIGLWSETIGVG